MSLSKEKVKRPKETGPKAVPEPGAAPGALGEGADLPSQLAAKTKEAEEHYDRLLRLAAEMENLKKRQEKERAELLQFATENLIKELLPVVDSLELALEHGRQQEAPQALLEGLELVHQGFLKALGRFGAAPIASVGQPFDPAFHNAVLEEEAPDVPEQTVIKELQKGYLMHSRLLRPAMVVVARNTQKTASQPD